LRQNFHFILRKQSRILLEALYPIQTGLGDEPSCQDSKSLLMPSGAVLSRLEFNPTKSIFGILVTAFDQIALRFAPGYLFHGNVCGSVTQDISGLGRIFTNEHPFLVKIRAGIGDPLTVALPDSSDKSGQISVPSGNI
jgi:hypothetical protein